MQRVIPAPLPAGKTLLAALLDIDGTFVLSNDAHARAWREAFAESGYDVPLERLRSMIGMGADKVVALVPGLRVDAPPGSTVAHRREEIFLNRYLPSVRPAPQGRALVQRIHAGGLRCIVASAAKQSERDALLRLAEIDDLVEITNANDDLPSKPDPDTILSVLTGAGVSAGEAIMIGDTPYDIEAAKRAGVPTIAVLSGGWDVASLAGALAVYKDVRDLLDRFDDSPLSGAPGSVGRATE